jgi:peptidoglycan/LPS O-acetylase OafA/YrhL
MALYFVDAMTLYLLVAAAAAILLVAALGSSAGWLRHPALIYLGRISYGLYVFHMAALVVTPAWWLPVRVTAAFGLTVAAAVLSYHFLEQPFLRLKRRFTYIRSEPPEPVRVAAPSAVPSGVPGG